MKAQIEEFERLNNIETGDKFVDFGEIYKISHLTREYVFSGLAQAFVFLACLFPASIIYQFLLESRLSHGHRNSLVGVRTRSKSFHWFSFARRMKFLSLTGTDRCSMNALWAVFSTLTTSMLRYRSFQWVHSPHEDFDTSELFLQIFVMFLMCLACVAFFWKRFPNSGMHKFERPILRCSLRSSFADGWNSRGTQHAFYHFRWSSDDAPNGAPAVILLRQAS